MPVKEKTERNKLIVSLVNKKWSLSEVAREVGVKSKATIHEIYHRDKAKYGRSDLQELSTA